MSGSTLSACVIGAGIAGLACARRLHKAGVLVRVFDKGRSPGGRVATRRVETSSGMAQFDHGAQFFTARDAGFQSALLSLTPEASSPWRGAGTGAGWRVGAPGMSALAKALADGLDVRTSTRIAAIARNGEGWNLMADDGSIVGMCDAVVVAVPAEQAVGLLSPVAPALAREAASAVTAPCWAGLFAFREPAGRERDVYETTENEVLSWAAREASKPGRRELPECWVVHARPDWTRAHLEDEPETVANNLLAAFASVAGPLPVPALSQAHRWRFAKVERPAGGAIGWDAAGRLGACGDWRLGPRVELAWRSGHDLAGAIIE